jgi:hypothetical protein
MEEDPVLEAIMATLRAKAEEHRAELRAKSEERQRVLAELLEEVARQINEAAAEGDLLTVGKLLVLAKRKIAHGYWKPWLDVAVPQLKYPLVLELMAWAQGKRVASYQTLNGQEEEKPTATLIEFVRKQGSANG